MVRSRVAAFVFRRSKQRVVNEIFIRLAFYVRRERRFPSVSLEAINFFLLFALRCCLYGCHDDAKEEESAMRSRGDRCIYVVVIHYPRLVVFCSSLFSSRFLLRLFLRSASLDRLDARFLPFPIPVFVRFHFHHLLHPAFQLPHSRPGFTPVSVCEEGFAGDSAVIAESVDANRKKRRIGLCPPVKPRG